MRVAVALWDSVPEVAVNVRVWVPAGKLAPGVNWSALFVWPEEMTTVQEMGAQVIPEGAMLVTVTVPLKPLAGEMVKL